MSNVKNAWLAGSVSAALLAGAAMWEGYSATPYQDIANVATVCYGHTGPEVIPGRTYSKAECTAYLARELRAASAGVLECTNVPLTQWQHDAFALFSYNVGTAAFCRSSLLKRLNAGDYSGACDGLMAWNRARVNGHLVEVRGLTRRRAFERDLCLRGAA